MVRVTADSNVRESENVFRNLWIHAESAELRLGAGKPA